MLDQQDQATRRIAMLGFEGFQILDVTGPLEVFSLAARILLEQRRTSVAPYEVVFAAREPGPVASSSGLCLHAACGWHELGPVDTLLVSGGTGTARALEDESLRRFLQSCAPLARRYGSVCTGALLLARAGLLSERRVSTHWAFIRELENLAPTARIEAEALFVRDGRLWTSAGVTAGMDMALAMIEEDWGRKLALEAAHRLVMYFKRPGAQRQVSAQLAAQAAAAEGRFPGLMAWMFEHLGEPLPVVRLAEMTGLSPRHFSRRFRTETGMTPARFVEGMRLETARTLLAEGREPLASVARQCGFGNVENLRRAFIRRLGVPPGAYRRRVHRETPDDL
jgi:transcriptional regulator GlxA family with amidase domain